MLSTLLLTLAVSASPIVRVARGPATLPIARRLNLTNVRSLYEHDLARAQNFKTHRSDKSKRAVINVPATNEVVDYVVTLCCGSPETCYQVIVDTGSSNTWVGAGKAYVVTSTSRNTGQPVSVTYGSGSFSGTEYLDQCQIGTGVIPSLSIGVASTSSGFAGVDGILGLGPDDLTQGTLTNEPNTEIPTITDDLFSVGLTSADEVGISFEPTTTLSNTNGELTFGGVDTSKFTGAITYVPITTTCPACFYWAIDLSITYGSATGTTILPTTAGIIDSGTTLLLIASDAYNEYRTLTGATLDATTGLLKITSTKYASLLSLFFHIGGTTFECTKNAQTWPRSLNTAIGGSASTIYLVINDIGSPSGSGLDFIIGLTFLERFYVVLDTTNHRVGIATTPFTTATTN